MFFELCLVMLSCTGHHVFGLQADFAVLSVGSREPGRSGQRCFPPHCSLRENIILEKLFLWSEGRFRCLHLFMHGKHWNVKLKKLVFRFWYEGHSYFDTRHSEGHGFNGTLAKSDGSSHFHITHITFSLWQETQPL